jgi:hypothetical protein
MDEWTDGRKDGRMDAGGEGGTLRRYSSTPKPFFTIFMPALRFSCARTASIRRWQQHPLDSGSEKRSYVCPRGTPFAQQPSSDCWGPSKAIGQSPAGRACGRFGEPRQMLPYLV